jgi:hypothetical protein
MRIAGKYAIALALLLGRPLAAEPRVSTGREVALLRAQAVPLTDVRYTREPRAATEIESYLRGYGAAASGIGQGYRDYTGGMINYELARSIAIQNRLDWRHAQFTDERMRHEQRKFQKSRGVVQPNPSDQRYAVVAKEAVIDWIKPLRASKFAVHRRAIETLLVDLREAREPVLIEMAQRSLRLSCGQLLATVEDEKDSLTVAEWESVQRFVKQIPDVL